MNALRDNSNCDGTGPHVRGGEVRTLPFPNGNLQLCFACFQAEMAWRRERNRALIGSACYDLPRWESLNVAYEAFATERGV